MWALKLWWALIQIFTIPAFAYRIYLTIHNILVTPKLVKEVTNNLDLSKTSGPDCIPVVVPKKSELELSYILAELFNTCLKESCFPDCWNVLSAVLIFKSVGRGQWLKTGVMLVFFLWLVKYLKNFPNDGFADDLRGCGHFSDFKGSFRSPWATPYLLTVVSGKIASF